MIDRDEAQQRVQDIIKDYLAEAQPANMQDVGNLLMNLISVAGVTLVTAVGHQEAVDRIQGTVDYIAENPNGRAAPVQPSTRH